MANNIDMFKLIQEVEKQQKLDVDAIFHDLDSVKDDVSAIVDSQAPRYSNTSNIKLIKRPTLPEDIGSYDTRFEAFRGIIEHVSYGYVTVNDYVEGHKDALEKYYKDAYNNSKDLYVIEARVNDEIQRNVSHAQLYEKGYYDGLLFVLKALNKSKELLMHKINKEININL